MTNALVFAIYLTLAMITATMIVVAILQNRSQRVIRDFVRLSVSVLGWQVCELLYTACRDEFWMRWLFDLKLPFVAFSAVLLLWFTLRFFRMEPYLRRGLFAVLSVVPAITALLALFSPWHNLLRRALVVAQISPLHIVINERGFWFWIHTVYCYVLLLLVAGVVLSNHHKLPRAYRTPSTMMVLGVIATMVSNALVITLFAQLPFDFTLVGMTAALVFVYVGVSISKQADFLMLARNEIFHYLEDHVFILDNGRNIIEANRSARGWMERLGVESGPGHPSFDSLLERLTDVWFGETGGEERYLAEPGGRLIFQVHERAVTDRVGQKLGAFVTLTDVTRYKMLIDDLERTAGIDPLTGLGNRRGYLDERRRMDRAEHLPLSVILGDINGLKAINDSLGHEQGDELLRVSAELLCRGCPDRARVFRIGGDEFVILLPHCPAEEARAVMACIQEEFAGEHGLGFVPSIALGASTKTSEAQEFSQILREADKSMYASKHADRRVGLPDRRVSDRPLPPDLPDRRVGPPDRRQLPDRRMGPPDRRHDLEDRLGPF